MPNKIETKLEEMKGSELILDQSGLSTFALCPRKFLYSNILHLKSKKEALPLTFGSAFHAALEKYYRGEPREKCYEAFILSATHEASQFKIYKVDAANQDKNTEYTLEFGIELLAKYFDSHPYEKEPFSVLKDSEGEPYLEIGFALALQHGILIGKIDGIIESKIDRAVEIFETKTTGQTLSSRYFDEFNPNNQISTYLIAASVLLGIEIKKALINAIRVKDYKRGDDDKNKEKLFARIPTTRTSDQLKSRYNEMEVQFSIVKNAIEIGIDAFYLNTMACYFKYSPCPYIPLCMATNIKVSELLMDSAYKVEPWSPYEIVQDVNKLYTIKGNEVESVEKFKV